jgi:hypothetical protein
MGTPAWTPIAWQSISTNTATVSFTSIPQTYTHLRLVISAVGNFTSGQRLWCNFNSDTGGNYNQLYGYGYGSGGNSGQLMNLSNGWLSYATYAGINDRMVSIADIYDYSATNKHKMLFTRNNDKYAPGVEILGMRWADTSAITRIDFVLDTASGASFAANTTFALYGISA